MPFINEVWACQLRLMRIRVNLFLRFFPQAIMCLEKVGLFTLSMRRLEPIWQ